MRKRYRKIVKSCVFVSLVVGLTTFFFDDFNSRRRTRPNVRRNHLSPEFMDSMRPSSFDLDLDRENEKWLLKEIHDSLPAGRLVCDRRRGRSPDALSEDVADVRLARMKSARLLMTQISPKRSIGCCPPGDRFGAPYKVGSACCVDKVFNVSTHFCCTTDEQVMPLTSDNLEHCRPFDGRHHCQIQSLEAVGAHGIEYNCTLNSQNNPVHCEFRCPLGSKPKNGVTSASCSEYGIFDRIPECCQGCDEEFQLNVIFLIQIPRNSYTNHSDILRKSVKEFISNFKIHQDNVRVGYRIVGSKRNHKFYSNPTDAAKAIDNISVNFADSDGTFVDALMSVTTEFHQLNIERPGVDTVVVLILQESLHSSAISGVEKLQGVARVLTITIGATRDRTATSTTIASSPEDSFQIADIAALSDVSNDLHDAVCGTECIL